MTITVPPGYETEFTDLIKLFMTFGPDHADLIDNINQQLNQQLNEIKTNEICTWSGSAADPFDQGLQDWINNHNVSILKIESDKCVAYDIVLKGPRHELKELLDTFWPDDKNYGDIKPLATPTSTPTVPSTVAPNSPDTKTITLTWEEREWLRRRLDNSTSPTARTIYYKL